MQIALQSYNSFAQFIGSYLFDLFTVQRTNTKAKKRQKKFAEAIAHDIFPVALFPFYISIESMASIEK